MKARWIEPAADADEKQEARFETWLSGEGIPFVRLLKLKKIIKPKLP